MGGCDEKGKSMLPAYLRMVLGNLADGGGGRPIGSPGDRKADGRVSVLTWAKAEVTGWVGEPVRVRCRQVLAAFGD